MHIHHKQRLVLSILMALLLLSSALSLSIGAVSMTFRQVLAIIADYFSLQLPWTFTPAQQAVLLAIRLPRVLLGLLVGSVLAVSGAAMQGLFRNPMADPGLIGISSGAALAAVAVIVLDASLLSSSGFLLSRYSLPIAAFGGGFATTLLVYRFASVNGRTDLNALLLAGIAINALAGAAIGLLTYLADDAQLRAITFWSMGSLGGATWTDVTVGLPFFLVTLSLLPLLSKALNALLLGEAEASHLGFPVETLKTLVVLLVAAGVGAAVSLVGIIGFVGLVVPHLLRLGLGPDHQILLPASALFGGSLLLIADLCARTWVVPAEIPIGILTGLLGAPFFLYLLRKQQLSGVA
jgi:iron complex transport system permease protein